MSEEKFTYDSVQDRESIGKYLMALAEGFRSGRLSFAWKDNEMTFSPEGILNFSLEAKRSEERRKLVLKIGWNEGAGTADGELTIETGETGEPGATDAAERK